MLWDALGCFGFPSFLPSISKERFGQEHEFDAAHEARVMCKRGFVIEVWASLKTVFCSSAHLRCFLLCFVVTESLRAGLLSRTTLRFAWMFTGDPMVE